MTGCCSVGAIANDAQVLLGIAYLAIVRDNLFHNSLHDYSSPAQVTIANWSLSLRLDRGIARTLCEEGVP